MNMKNIEAERMYRLSVKVPQSAAWQIAWESTDSEEIRQIRDEYSDKGYKVWIERI